MVFCRWGGTPVEDAVLVHDVIITRMLSNVGARLSQSFQRMSILQAARRGSTEMLLLLASCGADFSLANYDKVLATLKL
jgi:hypothetical protein